MRSLRITSSLMILLSFRIFGSDLPSNMSAQDVSRLTGVLGPSSALRMLRSAEAFPSWPGIKFGVEVMILPSQNIHSLGDGNGTIPQVNPVPRLYFCKGLFWDVDLVIDYLPNTLSNTISTLGIGLKWTYMNEKEAFASGAFYGGLTRIDAFDSNFLGTDFEMGVIFSRDYTRARPYLGGGLLMSAGSLVVPATRLALYDATTFAVHTFAGVEFKLPLSISLQFDIMNLSPMGSILLGISF